MKKKNIKKMNEDELELLAGIAKFHPFDKYGILVDKGDVKVPNWDAMLNWEDFPDWEDEMEDESIPMKDMTRAKRRKTTFRKHNQRVEMYLNKGYTINRLPKSDKGKLMEGVGDAPKVIHTDRMYFRGVKKMEKPMTTNEAKNLMAQMDYEAEQDREAEYKEAERQFALDELASTEDDLKRLTFMENEMKKAISNLVRTVYEANEKLVDFQAKVNGLQAAERILRNKIAKLEEVVNS